MKILLISFAGFLLFSATGLCQQPGRFQIVTGIFLDDVKGEEKVILKIDTATGETWKYDSLPINTTGRDLSPQELRDAPRMEGWCGVSPNPGKDIPDLAMEAKRAREQAAKQSR